MSFESVMGGSDAFGSFIESSDVLHTSGVSVKFLNELQKRIISNQEATGVTLKSLRKDVTHNGRVVPKGTTLQVDSAYAREGTSPYYDTVAFKPKEVASKPREKWTLDDILNFVILPTVKQKKMSYLDYVRKDRQGGVGKPFEAVYVSAAQETEFSTLLEGFNGQFGKSDEEKYVWINVFCTKHPLSKRDRVFLLRSGIRELISNFKQRIVYFPSWIDPMPLRDAWCVWDMFCFSQGNFEAGVEEQLGDESDTSFEILLPVSEEMKLADTLTLQFDSIIDNVKQIDVKMAKCQDPDEQKLIGDILAGAAGHDRRTSVMRAPSVLDPQDVGEFLGQNFTIQTSSSHSEVVNGIVKGKIWRWLTQAAESLSKPVLAQLNKDEGKLEGKLNSQKVHLVGCTGKILQLQGRFLEGKEYLKSALILSKLYFGEFSEDFATRLNNLGSLYSEMGELDSALDFHVESLNVRKEVSDGRTHPSMSVSLNNISLLLQKLGRYDEAITCQKQALNLDKHHYGDKHIEVGTDLTNLGMMYAQIGKFNRSLNLLNQSLEIHQKSFGYFHPKTAAVYNNLAATYSDKEDIGRAVKFQRRVLAIDVKIYGRENVEVANDLINLATYLSMNPSSTGNEEDEARSRKESQEMFLPGVGEGGEQADVLRESIKCFFEAIEIQLSIYGENHPNIATSLNNLAFVFLEREETEKAKRYGMRAVKILKSAYGDSHPYTIGALGMWGDKKPEEVEPVVPEEVVEKKEEVIDVLEEATKDKSDLYGDDEDVSTQKGLTKKMMNDEAMRLESRMIMGDVRRVKSSNKSKAKPRDELVDLLDEVESVADDESDEKELTQKDHKQRMEGGRSFFFGMQKTDISQRKSNRVVKKRKSEKFTPNNVAELLQNRESFKFDDSSIFKSGYNVSEFEPDWNEDGGGDKDDIPDDETDLSQEVDGFLVSGEEPIPSQNNGGPPSSKAPKPVVNNLFDAEDLEEENEEDRVVQEILEENQEVAPVVKASTKKSKKKKKPTRGIAVRDLIPERSDFAALFGSWKKR